jgi:hypothetical protein
MKYAVEMGSGAISSFINIGSGIQKLTGRRNTGTQKAWLYHKPNCLLPK